MTEVWTTKEDNGWNPTKIYNRMGGNTVFKWDVMYCCSSPLKDRTFVSAHILNYTTEGLLSLSHNCTRGQFSVSRNIVGKQDQSSFEILLLNSYYLFCISRNSNIYTYFLYHHFYFLLSVWSRSECVLGVLSWPLNAHSLEINGFSGPEMQAVPTQMVGHAMLA